MNNVLKKKKKYYEELMNNVEGINSCGELEGYYPSQTVVTCPRK